MTSKDFLSSLSKGGTVGSFLFYGDEDYLKRHALLTAREKTVEPALDAFNHFRFDEDSFSLDALWNAQQAVPMMDDRKLIEIIGVSLNDLSEEDFAELCVCLKGSAENASLLILYTTEAELDPGTEKQPSKRMKALCQAAQPVLFATETPLRLEKWIQKHFAADGVTVSPTLPGAMLTYCGDDMFALSGEIAKLCAYAHARAERDGGSPLTVSEEDLETVCARNEDFDAFALTDAVLSGNTERAYAVLSDMKARREKPELILGGIAGVACDLYLVKSLSDSGLSKSEIASKLKMHEYRVGLFLKRTDKTDLNALRRFAARCYEADKRIKSTFSDSYEGIEKLIL